jgi:hypothetical protein
VADRFQVKVIGQGSGLEPERRHELLGAFDLQALAALQPRRLPPASGEQLPQLELKSAAPQPAS